MPLDSGQASAPIWAMIVAPASTMGVRKMSKGMDQKKETKKKPTKTIKEKRAEKKAKKESRGG